jgi:hypothetical protein
MKLYENTLKILQEHSKWTTSYLNSNLVQDEKALLIDTDKKKLPIVVADFIKNFGGVEVHFPHPSSTRMKEDCFHFNIAEAIAHTDTHWITCNYSDRVGENLYVVGEAFHSSMVLCMSETGRYYAGADEYLVYLGADINAALESLYTGGQNVKRVPDEVMQSFLEKISPTLQGFISRNEVYKQLDNMDQKDIPSWLNVELGRVLRKKNVWSLLDKSDKQKIPKFQLTTEYGVTYRCAIEKTQDTLSTLESLKSYFRKSHSFALLIHPDDKYTDEQYTSSQGWINKTYKIRMHAGQLTFLAKND